MGDPRDASVATVVGRFLLFVPAEVTAPWCAAAGSRRSAKLLRRPACACLGAASCQDDQVYEVRSVRSQLARAHCALDQS